MRRADEAPLPGTTQTAQESETHSPPHLEQARSGAADTQDLNPPPPSRALTVNAAAAGKSHALTGCARTGCGCFTILALAVAVLIIGIILWIRSLPRDVGYSDVLTQQDATTFAEHNTGWNNDDPNNVAYVQRAMRHLGNKAYGRTFGDLMDWEKDYEARETHRRQLAYWRLHPTPAPEPQAQIVQEAQAEQRHEIELYLTPLCHDFKMMRDDFTAATIDLQGGNPVAASEDLKDASDWLDTANQDANTNSAPDSSDYTEAAVVSIQYYKHAVSDTRSYLDDSEPSTMADANEQGKQGALELVAAYLDIKQQYKAAGGNSNDLCPLLGN